MLKRFLPILDWLPNYKKEYLTGDISAGLTVGIMLIPQGMAYAMIAGLPPVFGLYAALIPQMVYAILGTSRQLAVGPVAMDSLLVASGLGALSISGMDEYIAMAIFLALFMGSIQLLLGLMRMGFLVNFLSKPVISGFTSAAAIIIGLSQLKHLLGTDIERSNQIHILLQNALRTIDQTNLYTLGIGVTAIFLLKGFKKINRKIPAALLIVSLGIVWAYFFKIDLVGVKIVAKVPSGLPSFGVPSIDFSRIDELLPIALTLALIAFMEAISVSKAVEVKHREYEVNANQELIALGASNIMGAFFQSYPTTGGFSRTAVNDQSGAKTGIAAFVSVLVVGLTLLFLTPLFYYLPNAILAAIIMVAVFGLIDVKYPKRLFKNRKDEFVLLMATFVITLTVGIKEGILLGVLLSLLLLVYRTSKPHLAILGKIRGANYFKNISRFEKDAEIDPRVLIIRFDSQLYFGNKDYFKNELSKLLNSKIVQPEAIIIKAEPINYIDSSAVFMLENLVQEFREKNIKILFSDVIGPVRDIIQKSELVDKIGREHFFVNTLEAYDYALNNTPKNNLQEKISLQSKEGTYVT
ncbi:solute carrier family 26 protein [Flagellimonas sp. HMM57]|uniref:SulP family inorganic anion transporter n=1 Tax=unclassified Flagellimonas TaxID=2644544 RepID=UPI0013D24772|nr:MULTISPECIES: solute carrier family 26 protein [unclassified Flagellimonas]UII76488.1 solute carrier family 26 protein [Flagellimonas sp. HMM57]